MAKKTTKVALEAINYFGNCLSHFEEIIRVKETVPVENQADHIRNKSFSYYEGWITGILAATENVIHNQGCWHGFSYINRNGLNLTPTPGFYIGDDPEYRDYRVCLHVKL